PVACHLLPVFLTDHAENVTDTTFPGPALSRKRASPPCSRAIRATTARPRPVPRARLGVNGAKALSRTSAGSVPPGPLTVRRPPRCGRRRPPPLPPPPGGRGSSLRCARGPDRAAWAAAAPAGRAGRSRRAATIPLPRPPPHRAPPAGGRREPAPGTAAGRTPA